MVVGAQSYKYGLNWELYVIDAPPTTIGFAFYDVARAMCVAFPQGLRSVTSPVLPADAAAGTSCSRASCSCGV